MKVVSYFLRFLGFLNIGALVIRIGFCDPLNYNYSKWMADLAGAPLSVPAHSMCCRRS